MYIRYRFIREVYENNSFSESLFRLNKISFFIGVIAVGGLSVVANFQETNLLLIHLLGAVMSFGVGAIYLILQTTVSYKVISVTGTRCLLHTRIVLSGMSSVAFVMTIVFAGIAVAKYTGIFLRKILQ